MSRKLLWLAIILLVPGWSWAQKMERPKDPEVGDKIVRNWVLNNKAQQITQEVQAVTDTEIQESQKVGDKTFDLVLSKSNLAVTKAMCESNGQPCIFAPALEWAVFPLEKGKKWGGTTTVTGESFTAEERWRRSRRSRPPPGNTKDFEFTSADAYEEGTLRAHLSAEKRTARFGLD